MFCPNCGAQLPDGSAFCPQCGAATGGEPRAEEPVLEQDPNLPEGIFRDENGAYHWVYHMSMLRNPVPLYTVFKIFFVIVSVMSVILFFATLGDGLAAALKQFAIGFFGFNALFFVLGLMAWGIMSITRGGRYTFEHMMDEEMVASIQTPEERKRSERLGMLGVAAGTASGNLSAAGFALAQGSRGDMFSSRYSEVKQIIAKRRMDVIKVNNTLRRNQIYAYPHQYEFVWNYITSHCPEAKIKG